MSMKNLELSVGAFMVLGMASLVALAVQVSGLSLAEHGDRYTLYARFDNVGGLKPRAKVSSAGVVIGQVMAIRLDPVDYMAVVEMKIDHAVDFIADDSIAAIQTSGVLGDKYVSISLGADADMLGDGDEIEDTASAIVLEDLIGKALTMLSDSRSKESK